MDGGCGGGGWGLVGVRGRRIRGGFAGERGLDLAFYMVQQDVFFSLFLRFFYFSLFHHLGDWIWVSI